MQTNVIDIKVIAKDLATSVFKGIKSSSGNLASSIKNSIGKVVKKAFEIAKVAAIGLGTALAALNVKAVLSASDAQESYSKFATVFSDVAGKAEQASRDLANSFGLSRLEAKKLMGNTGDLLTGFGVGADLALDMSVSVNELAVDLASFTNAQGGAKAVSDALTKAMLGEREALKTYGIAIMEADIQAELLARGMDDLTGEALRQAKAQVTLDLAMRQSKNAVGDFARTSDSFANQMRVARARVSDLLVSIGGLNDDGTLKPGGLLDVGTQLLNKFTSFVEENREQIIQLVDSLVDLAGKGFGVVIDVIKQVIKFFQDNRDTAEKLFYIIKDLATAGFEVLKDAIKTVVDVVSGIIKFFTDASPLAQILTTFLGSLAAVFLVVNAAIGIWNIVVGIATVVTGGFAAVMAFLTSPITLVILAIAAIIAIIVLAIQHFDKIKEVVGEVFGFIGSIVTSVVDGVVSVISAGFSLAVNTGIGYFEALKGAISTVMETIRTIVTSVVDWVVGKFNDVIDAIKGFVSGAANLGGTLLDTIKGVINKFVVDPFNNFSIKIPVIDKTINLPDIPRLSGGGDFIVPPGFNNDTFPILVESGERVQVTPKDQVGQASSGGNITININGAGNPMAIAKEVQRVLAQSNQGQRLGLNPSF